MRLRFVDTYMTVEKYCQLLENNFCKEKVLFNFIY